MSDPLGRLAHHASRPYPEPNNTHQDLIRFWQREHEISARGMTNGELAEGIAEKDSAIAILAGEHTDGAQARMSRMIGIRKAYERELSRRRIAERGGDQ